MTNEEAVERLTLAKSSIVTHKRSLELMHGCPAMRENDKYINLMVELSRVNVALSQLLMQLEMQKDA